MVDVAKVLHILGKMAELGLAAPRPKVSEKAPTMIKMRIPTNKIRDVIGSGGSVIKGMQSQTGCTINIDDDGNIDIAAPSGKAAAVCRRMIEELTAEPEPGRKYKGKVKTIQPFGAFVEILPGRDGLALTCFDVGIIVMIISDFSAISILVAQPTAPRDSSLSI